MSSPLIPPPSGESAWAGLGAMGAMGGLMGLMGGLGRRREPETKREKALAASETLSDLCDTLEDMTRNAECLIGSEAQGTISPFNADVNAVVGEIAVLRRRAMIVQARLHAITFPKIKDDLQKVTKKLEEAEAAVTQVLAMPDLTPEQEAEIKQVSKDKKLVIQALSMEDGARSFDEIVEDSGVPDERVRRALTSLVTDTLVEATNGGWRRASRKLPDVPFDLATSEIKPPTPPGQ